MLSSRNHGKIQMNKKVNMKNTIKIAYLFSIFLFFRSPALGRFWYPYVEEHGNVIRKLDRERKRKRDIFFKDNKPKIRLRTLNNARQNYPPERIRPQKHKDIRKKLMYKRREALLRRHEKEFRKKNRPDFTANYLLALAVTAP